MSKVPYLNKTTGSPLITTNGSYFIGTANKKRDMWKWAATFYAYGTFGGGTITWQISPDSGTTLITMYDLSNVAITSTANDMFNSELGTGSNLNDGVQIWATLAGATAPSLQVGYFDNNN